MRKTRGRPLAACAIRWMVAGLATIGVFLAPLESRLPDVHDISSSAESGQTSPDRNIRSEDLASAMDVHPIHTPSDQTNGHTFHVDHRCHGHCLSLGVSRTAVSVGDVRRLAVQTISPELSGVTISPRHRPPIA